MHLLICETPNCRYILYQHKEYLTGQWMAVSNNSASNKHLKLTKKCLEKFITGLPSGTAILQSQSHFVTKNPSDISRLKYHFIDSEFLLHKLTWL